MIGIIKEYKYFTAAIGAGKNKKDPEKSVLPTIIFINIKHPEYDKERGEKAGFVICVGWWDWSINLALIWETKRTD